MLKPYGEEDASMTSNAVVPTDAPNGDGAKELHTLDLSSQPDQLINLIERLFSFKRIKNHPI